MLTCTPLRRVAPRCPVLIAYKIMNARERLMNKPNWVCVGCGMCSSRKYSGKRHISKVHNGFSMMVSFTEYIVGRYSGLCLSPMTVGLGRKPREPEKTTLLYTSVAEFWKERARQAARKDFQGSW